MNLMDTLVWLVNFPVTHGYAMVFIAGFAMLGLLSQATRPIGARSRLSTIRAREGLVESGSDRRSRVVIARLQRLFFRVLAVVMGAGLVLGILGLIGVPVTSAYIHDNGQPAVATVDGDWVRFTTATGVEYTLPNDFFTPSMYPDRDAWVPSGDIVVRYLPSHPQAYVIDTEQLPD
ncbi:hypothetical protein [Microbacterium sp. CIAB417]|uniref:hypothetical protein n=1 Tax=Microbacterium sp. CIAB417 TaxID=2860287 RepID=UPI001FAD9B1C|nr:hypothetical protein [Microbacterium sp. CIAB417]